MAFFFVALTGVLFLFTALSYQKMQQWTQLATHESVGKNTTLPNTTVELSFIHIYTQTQSSEKWYTSTDHDLRKAIWEADLLILYLTSVKRNNDAIASFSPV